MGKRTSVAACVLFLVGACGANPPRWTPAEDLSADDAVVHLSNKDSAMECTGVLIGPRSALTAAHCVGEPGPIRVRVGTRQVAVEECTVHPSAYGAPRACGQHGRGWSGRGRTDLEHDLAVLTLAEPVQVRPVPLLLTAPVPTGRWWSRRPVRLVGWDRRPRFVGPLERRSGMNQIVRLEGGAFTTEPVLRSGFTTIIGDSGGPALVRIRGAERVAGVLGGGPASGSSESIYVATFEPSNARWLLEVLPELGRDLAHDERRPFGPSWLLTP